MTAAQSTVIKQIKALREDIKQHEETGKTPWAFPDLENEQARLGLSQALMVKALALAAIIAWEGVMQPGSDDTAAINEQTVSELMDIWFIGQEFWDKYTTSFTMAEIEGNGSRPAANGTTAAGLPTAPAASRKTSRAAKASATP